MSNKIELGDKVKCIYTGYYGIATAKTEFINGCIQYVVAAKVDKENKCPEEVSIDQDSLRVIQKGPKHNKEEAIGGPMRKAPKQGRYRI